MAEHFSWTGACGALLLMGVSSCALRPLTSANASNRVTAPVAKSSAKSAAKSVAESGTRSVASNAESADPVNDESHDEQNDSGFRCVVRSARTGSLYVLSAADITEGRKLVRTYCGQSEAFADCGNAACKPIARLRDPKFMAELPLRDSDAVYRGGGASAEAAREASRYECLSKERDPKNCEGAELRVTPAI